MLRLFLGNFYTSFMSAPLDSSVLLEGIRSLILSARQVAARGVNLLQVYTNYEIGRRIVEEEQRGADRAEYGKQVLKELAERLTSEFGNGFSRSNLQYMRGFYLAYPDRGNQIRQTLSGKLSSRDHAAIRDLSQHGQQVEKPQDLLKEPYVLEFLGLEEKAGYSESDLETAIVDHVEHFLLELGKGFLFEARQKRITFDEEHFFVDLVFYNRLLRAYVLVDLKIGKLAHQDLGQLQMYVNYLDRFVKTETENSTIGIVLSMRTRTRNASQSRAQDSDHQDRARNRGRGCRFRGLSAIGLDAGRSSADYIQLYHGNAALLAGSLEVIQRTSALILSAFETPSVVAEETDASLAEAS
jgi:predicted nuclease of restriction endonuclease-like (RecB) superfamily